MTVIGLLVIIGSAILGAWVGLSNKNNKKKAEESGDSDLAKSTKVSSATEKIEEVTKEQVKPIHLKDIKSEKTNKKYFGN